MPEVDKTPLEVRFGRYQALVVGGLAFIVVFAISVMGILLWQAYSIGQQAQKVEQLAVTTHGALCTFREDLQRRHDNAVDFLEDNPGGFGGITASTLQTSIDNQKATLDALAAGGLTCTE